MFGTDEWIAAQGGGWVFVFLIGALLGVRHATDPDHLSALLTLRLKQKQQAPHRLGMAWGLGHAVSMIVVGIPLIFLFGDLPENIQVVLEFSVGVLISVLAIRVLANLFFIKIDDHVHRHHDGLQHSHPHTHTSPGHTHRSHKAGLLIGVLHGTGGSAGAVALILSRMPSHLMASLALVVLTIFTALSMTFCSWAICKGVDVSAERITNTRRFTIFGAVSALVFGLWYALAAVNAVPYFF